MTRVFLYCEGVTDFDPICILMKKAAGSAELTIIRKTRNDLRNETRVLSGRRGVHKHETYIDRLAMAAKKANCRHIAYHQDADNDDSNVYKRVNGKLSDFRGKYRCLAVVPKEMIESWLLADEQAFVTAFGWKPVRPTLPAKPEALWGKKENPNSRHPKHVMKSILKQYHMEPDRAAYAEIATNCNIDTLRRRCNISFDRFFKDLQGFIDHKFLK